MCAPRVTRHTSIRYSSSCQHASTWVHRYSSLLQWSVPLGKRCHVAMVGWILCTKCTLHSNHRHTHVIFQHTERLLPRSGHFLTTYTRIAWRKKCELRLTLILLKWRIWWDPNNVRKWQMGFNSAFKGLKRTYWEKRFWVFPSICTGFVNTCPTVFL